MPVFHKRIVVGDRSYLIATDGEYGRHLGERFEPSTSALLAALCDPSSHVLDIGANIGVTALLFSSLTPEGTVNAVEPVPAAFNLLDENVTTAAARNVTLHNFALGSESGSVHMQGARDNLSGSFVADKHSIDDEGHFDTEVALHRLDDVVSRFGAERIDLVKMDVEGYELEVLEGARAMLQAHQPVVMLEMNYVALNLWRKMPLPEFRDRLLEIFPYVYATQDGQWLDFRDSKQGHHIMFSHLTSWAYMDVVAGFDDEDLRRRLQRTGPARQRFDQAASELLAAAARRDLVEEQERRIAQLSAALEAADRRVDELEVISASARKMVSDMEGSRSWRLTAPLRAFRRSLRRD